jgi:hypothetical protein
MNSPMTSVEYGTSETELTEVGVRVLIVDLSQKFGGASSRVLTLMRNLPVGQVTLAALENSPIAVEAIRLGLPVIFVGASKVSPIIRDVSGQINVALGLQVIPNFMRFRFECIAQLSIQRNIRRSEMQIEPGPWLSL